MLHLEDVTATVTSYNSRGETHGESIVPAHDLGLQINCSNTVLAFFGPTLRQSLYAKAAAGRAPREAAQGELPVEPAMVTDLPHLKNPCIVMPIKLAFEGEGYRAVIDYGIGGDSDIVLTDCKVKNVRVDCQEGGTVVMRLRITKAEMDLRASGILSNHVQQDVVISLIPPSADQSEIEA